MANYLEMAFAEDFDTINTLTAQMDNLSSSHMDQASIIKGCTRYCEREALHENEPGEPEFYRV